MEIGRAYLFKNFAQPFASISLFGRFQNVLLSRVQDLLIYK